MNKILGLVMLCLVGCVRSESRLDSQVDAAAYQDSAPEVADVVTQRCLESKTVLFCRPEMYSNFDQHNENMRLALNITLNEGWRYAGPLHNDGINCQRVFFTRETTVCSSDR